ncbi:MAG: hypothetical protein ACYTG0_47445 [Planctomycetota bacterium]|jgi:hypothetical protein
MSRRGLIVSLVGIVISVWLLAANATADHPVVITRHHRFVDSPSRYCHRPGFPSGCAGTPFYPEYTLGPYPGSDRRAGVPSFNWGYFGAQPGKTCVRHLGYYGRYIQWGSRGRE